MLRYLKYDSGRRWFCSWFKQFTELVAGEGNVVVWFELKVGVTDWLAIETLGSWTALGIAGIETWPIPIPMPEMYCWTPGNIIDAMPLPIHIIWCTINDTFTLWSIICWTKNAKSMEIYKTWTCSWSDLRYSIASSSIEALSVWEYELHILEALTLIHLFGVQQNII